VNRAALAIAFLLAACAKSEGTIDLVKNIATEARTKPRVEVMVKMSGEQAAPEDLALQKSIEDRIEQAHVGRLISSGNESGFMRITVEVDNTADSIAKMRKVLQTLGVLERASFKVSTGS
jgi:hypothetical protein